MLFLNMCNHFYNISDNSYRYSFFHKAAAEVSFPLWVRNDGNKQALMSDNKDMRKCIQNRFVFLTKTLNPSSLWELLLEMDAVDYVNLEDIQVGVVTFESKTTI